MTKFAVVANVVAMLVAAVYADVIGRCKYLYLILNSLMCALGFKNCLKRRKENF